MVVQCLGPRTGDSSRLHKPVLLRSVRTVEREFVHRVLVHLAGRMHCQLHVIRSSN
jgi:hypothetical protein